MKSAFFIGTNALLKFIRQCWLLYVFAIFHLDSSKMILISSFFVGLAYIPMGVIWNKKWMNITILTCGLFLIVSCFVPTFYKINLYRTIGLVLPMLLVRFVPEKNKL